MAPGRQAATLEVWRSQSSLHRCFFVFRDYPAGAMQQSHSGDIILQLITIPDGARIQAKMYGKDGVSHAIWGEPGTGGWFAKGLSKEEMDAIKFKPLFRYPSERHFGELIHVGKRK